MKSYTSWIVDSFKSSYPLSIFSWNSGVGTTFISKSDGMPRKWFGGGGGKLGGGQWPDATAAIIAWNGVGTSPCGVGRRPRPGGGFGFGVIPSFRNSSISHESSTSL